MGTALLMHPVAAQPHECGECRVFNILSRVAFKEYMKGEPVYGECRRFAPNMSPHEPIYPRVWSNFEVCPYALGRLDGVSYGPIA